MYVVLCACVPVYVYMYLGHEEHEEIIAWFYFVTPFEAGLAGR